MNLCRDGKGRYDRQTVYVTDGDASDETTVYVTDGDAADETTVYVTDGDAADETTVSVRFPLSPLQSVRRRVFSTDTDNKTIKIPCGMRAWHAG